MILAHSKEMPWKVGLSLTTTEAESHRNQVHVFYKEVINPILSEHYSLLNTLQGNAGERFVLNISESAKIFFMQ